MTATLIKIDEQKSCDDDDDNPLKLLAGFIHFRQIFIKINDIDIHILPSEQKRNQSIISETNLYNPDELCFH